MQETQDARGSLTGIGTPPRLGFIAGGDYSVILRALLCSSILALIASTSPALADPAVRPAPLPVKPVTENYFGTKVTDPYRYMENLKDPQVLTWVRGQGVYTRAVLGSIPNRTAFLHKVAAFSGAFDFVNSSRASAAVYSTRSGRQARTISI